MGGQTDLVDIVSGGDKHLLNVPLVGSNRLERANLLPHSDRDSARGCIPENLLRSGLQTDREAEKKIRIPFRCDIPNSTSPFQKQMNEIMVNRDEPRHRTCGSPALAMRPLHRHLRPSVAARSATNPNFSQNVFCFFLKKMSRVSRAKRTN